MLEDIEVVYEPLHDISMVLSSLVRIGLPNRLPISKSRVIIRDPNTLRGVLADELEHRSRC